MSHVMQRYTNIAEDSVDGEVQWVTRYADTTGIAYPGSGTMSDYRVHKRIEEGTPLVAGTTHVDDSFPSSLPNLQTWYRSDDTEGMTFATGDKDAGGTISAMWDMTRTKELDTATSGVNAPTFHPGGAVRGGFPSIEGGNNTTAAGIEKNAPTANAADTQQRIQWSVGTFGDAGLLTSWGGTQGTVVLGCTYSGFKTDDVAKPACSYVAGTTTPGWQVSYGIANSGPPADNGDIHIYVWRSTVDAGAGQADVESWYAGLKLPDRRSTNADGTIHGQAIGLTSSGNFDANGAQFLEMGCAFSTSASVQTYTDANVEDLIRYLCNRYSVDYMPDSTPKTVGAWSRQTSTVGQDDLVYYFRAEDQYFTKTGDTITSWAQSEYVTQHTRDVNSTDGDNPPDATINMLDREGTQSVSASSEHLRDATGYVWSETSVFPTDNDEYSMFVIGRNNAKISSGYVVEGPGIIRQNSTTGKIEWRANANNLVGTDDVDGVWVCVIGTYEGIAGDQNLYVNADSVNTTDGSPAGLSTTYPNTHASNAGSGFNSCELLEYAAWKHVLTLDEKTALQEYAKYRYNETSDFGL